MRSWILAGCLLGCFLSACGGRGARTAPLETVPALDLPRVQPSPAAGSDTEAVSLFGQPLAQPPLSPEAQADREAKLAAARAEAEAHPGDVDALIWLGRRTAYLGRYREAIDVFSRGLEKHPDEPRLLRHRGHRYISIRRFDLAVADLERAARVIAGRPDEVEPDGLPNARNIPVSTLQTNVWYHLGLAYYYLGDLSDLRNAERAFRECLQVSKNADMQVATTHWLYMILRRLGRVGEANELLAPIRTDMDVIENRSYHWLVLMYKGEIPADSILTLAGQEGLDPATLGYGVGNWHLYNGKREEAVRAFRQVLAGDQWSAFGYIAAEADLKRLGESPEHGLTRTVTDSHGQPGSGALSVIVRESPCRSVCGSVPGMKRYRVKPGSRVDLSRLDAGDTSAFPDGKKATKKVFEKLNGRLEALQEMLWAEHRHKVLVVLQGLDTSGKDGTIRQVFDGVNPQGVRVASFKAPTPEELDHDFLWRVHPRVPGRGEMVIFNRSHYEDVLAVRVKKLAPAEVWKPRYDRINEFESLLAESGTTILKFFLHIDKDEQKERLQERLDDPTKRWKFRKGDLADRELWQEYTKAYQDVLARTSKDHAPWYVVPANRNWYRNLVVATVLVDTLEKLDMKYPAPEEDLDGIVIDQAID